MDTNTQAALNAAADAAMSEYQTDESRERALRLKNVLTDGVCRIVDVQDQLHPPCVGIIHTDLGERFAVFDIFTREQAKTLKGMRVRFDIRMSEKGTRYVKGMAMLPTDTESEVWPCARCGASAWLRTKGDGKGKYCCLSCAYQMEVGP